MESILGHGEGIVQPPQAMTPPARNITRLLTSQSLNLDDRQAIEGALAAEGVHREIHVDDLKALLPHDDGREDASTESEHKDKNETDHSRSRARAIPHRDGYAAKGQAHDPSDDSPIFLEVGPGGATTDTPSLIVSESPPAADINIYDAAYRKEVERIRETQGVNTKVFLTKRVDQIKGQLVDKGLLVEDESSDRPKVGWSKLLEKSKLRSGSDEKEDEGSQS